MAETKKNKVVYAATYGWLEVAEKQGLVIDWDTDCDLWDLLPQIAEAVDGSYNDVDFDPEDSELGFATVVESRDCDEAIKAGDVIVTQGYGGDVVFLRLEKQASHA